MRNNKDFSCLTKIAICRIFNLNYVYGLDKKVHCEVAFYEKQ